MRKLFIFILLLATISNAQNTEIFRNLENNMVFVSGDTFLMGNAEGNPIEYPVHSVTLSSFMISKYEVSQELWFAVMGNNPSVFVGDRLPVNNISWDECQEFIRKLNNLTGKKYRLPTEAEWEFAARGGVKRAIDVSGKGIPFSGGFTQTHQVGEYCWFSGNSANTPHEIGTKKANELGLYDMSGNVCEWVYDASYAYSDRKQENPKYEVGIVRMLRGGSYNWGLEGKKNIRVSGRTGSPQNERMPYLGLRLALDATDKPEERKFILAYTDEGIEKQKDFSNINFVRDGMKDSYAWTSGEDKTSTYAMLGEKFDIKNVKYITRFNVKLLSAKEEKLHELMTHEWRNKDTDVDADATVVALKENPNVEETFTDGYNVYIKQKSDNGKKTGYVAYPVCPIPDPFYDGEEENGKVRQQVNSFLQQYSIRKSSGYKTTYHTTGTRNKRIAIFNYFSSYDGTSYMDANAGVEHLFITRIPSRKGQNRIVAAMSNMFQEHGYSVDYFAHEDCTIEEIRNIIKNSADYAAIIIMSHGGRFDANPSSSAHRFVTTTPVVGLPVEGDYHYYDKDDQKSYQTMDVQEFGSVSRQCIVYNGACNGGDMLNIHTPSVSWSGINYTAQAHCALFFSRMLDDGLTMKDACESIWKKDFREDGGVLGEVKYNTGAYYNTLAGNSDESTYHPSYKIELTSPHISALLLKDVSQLPIEGRFISSDFPEYFRIKFLSIKDGDKEGSIKIRVNKDGTFSTVKKLSYFFSNGVYRMVPFYDAGIFSAEQRIRIVKPQALVYSDHFYENSIEEIEHKTGNLLKIVDSKERETYDIALKKGETQTLVIFEDDEANYKVTSANPNIATVALSGVNVMIKGESVGKTTITVEDLQSGFSSVITTSVTEANNGEVPEGVIIENGVLKTWPCDKIPADGHVTIPSSVTTIGDHAFYDCSSLTSITIPSSVTTIEDEAFGYCSSLTSITIPSSVTTIRWGTFYGCESLTSITIPSSVTTIGAAAFYGCSSLTSITIPSSVTTIEGSAFFICRSLTSITIPSSVTTIGVRAFYGCESLTSITIPSSVTTIEDEAFEYCRSLTSISIPSSVTTIGAAAFYGCSSLTSITIPSSVTTIGKKAFGYCSSLTSITIPSSVTTIGKKAFGYCSSLTSIRCKATTPPKTDTDLGYDGKLIVPAGTKKAYEEAEGWRNCSPIVEE